MANGQRKILKMKRVKNIDNSVKGNGLNNQVQVLCFFFFNVKTEVTKIVLHLVSVYSLSPECKFMAEKVPMHPRNLLSRPIFHVTNSGLQWKIKTG